MSKNIILIGAGGLGKEVFHWFSRDEKFTENIKGFLDKSDPDFSKCKIKANFLGNEDTYEFNDDDYVVITIADVKIRSKIYSKLKNKVQFINLIHSKAIISENVMMGTGNVICPNCIISNNVSMGNNNFININASICHESIIRNNVILSPYSLVNGQCIIDDDVFIGSHATVFQNSRIGKESSIEANTLVKGDIKKNLYVCGVPGRILPKK
ncbi:MAG: acetyltransferase [Gammaproteobacteria bacterium]|nr:acetyltransferase [Gammaproteobacteria bacterium]